MKHIVIGIIVALVLAACGANQQNTPPAPTESLPPDGDNTPTPEGEATPIEGEGTASDEQLPPPPDEAGMPGTTFAIVPGESEARFYIDEVLLGNEVTVEGVNTDVSGEVVVDYDNLVTTTFRPITIDANGFVTDNNNRNRAIQRFVLETGQQGNETILFEISSVEGLPDAATIGETYDVTIDGILTILGQTNPVSFTGTLTPVSETRIEGSLSAEDIDYAQWGITIPQPPSVTFVADAFSMEFDLVAEAQE